MAKRINLRRIKANRPYSVEELADAARVTEPTVRRWFGEGLRTLDENRPAIVMGFQAQAFLGARQIERKQPMELDQFYCFTCKARTRPLGLMADHIEGPNGGRLVALCEACGGMCSKNISRSQLADVSTVLDIASNAKSRP